MRPNVTVIAGKRASFVAATLVLAAFHGLPGINYAVAAPETEIVGRWDVIRSGSKGAKDVAGYMRFNKNGTFTSTLLFLATKDGKYKIISSKVVELDFPGIIYGRNKVEFKYYLNKETLKLEGPNSIDLEFKRIDSGR